MIAHTEAGVYQSEAVDDDLWLDEEEVVIEDAAEQVEAPAAPEPRKTMPCPASTHDALVLDVAARFQAIGKAVADTITMSPSDRGDALGVLLDELDAERARIVSARDAAYEQAEVEGANSLADELESRWNAENHGGMS